MFRTFERIAVYNNRIFVVAVWSDPTSSHRNRNFIQEVHNGHNGYLYTIPTIEIPDPVHDIAIANNRIYVLTSEDTNLFINIYDFNTGSLISERNIVPDNSSDPDIIRQDLGLGLAVDFRRIYLLKRNQIQVTPARIIDVTQLHVLESRF